MQAYNDMMRRAALVFAGALFALSPHLAFPGDDEAPDLSSETPSERASSLSESSSDVSDGASEPKHSGEPKGTTGGRIALESTLGILGAGVSFGVGLAPVAISCSGTAGCAGALPVGAAVGGGLSLFGIPAGVSAAGYIMNARGNYGFSLLGTLIGGGVGATMGFLFGSAGAIGVTAATIPLLTLSGAVLAYELNHRDRMEQSSSSKQSRVRPIVGYNPTRTRATLGVAVTF